MTRALAAALALMFAAAPAGADPPAVQLATLTASSVLGGRATLHAPYRAFDADTRTAWCPARRDDRAGGALTISFEHPVHVRSLTLYGSEHVGGPERTLPLEVTGDGGTVAVAFEADSDLGQEVDVSPSPTTSLRFHFGAVPEKDRKAACLWDIELELAEGPFIYGATPAARDALRESLRGINQALADCDATGLRSWVRFPVMFRETAMVFAHHRSYSGNVSVLATAPAKLNCAMLHDDDPMIEQGIAPGVVRVAAGTGTGAMFWEIVWKSGKWLLSGMDTVFFE